MKIDRTAIEKRLEQSLSPKRYRHILGCAEESVRLAERWGADPEAAETAALLHDITKELDDAEQLKMCEKFGIIPNNAEKCSPGLLHAATAAQIARREYGQPDEVCNAIRYHTTARAGMSLLEKILFVADFIEPTRTFDHDEMTVLAYSELDEAVLYGLVWLIREVVDKGALLHGDNIGGYNDLLWRKNNR